MKKASLIIFCIFLASALSGCGEGGVESAKITSPPAAATQAAVVISANGAVGTRVGGVEVTLLLPPGVTVKSAVNPPQPDADVVVPLGGAATDSMVLANYTPQSGQHQGKVFIGVGSSAQNGFGLGEVVKVNCNIAAGFSPKATDFATSDFKAIDLNTGTSISGVTAGLTVDLR